MNCPIFGVWTREETAADKRGPDQEKHFFRLRQPRKGDARSLDSLP